MQWSKAYCIMNFENYIKFLKANLKRYVLSKKSNCWSCQKVAEQLVAEVATGSVDMSMESHLHLHFILHLTFWNISIEILA